MKFKRNYLLLIILCLFIFPKDVFAEEPIANDISCTTRNISVSICDSEECDFNDLDEAFHELMNYNNYCTLDNLSINIGEGYYYVDYFELYDDITNLTIKGDSKEKTVIEFNKYFYLYFIGNVNISNLTIKSNYSDEALFVYESDKVLLNNILVDAKNSYIGIELSHNDIVKTNGVVVRNAKAFGIYNNRCRRYPQSSDNDQISYSGPIRGKTVTIENSDVSNNSCGVLDGCFDRDKAIERSFEPIANREMLTYDYDTTVIGNSKIACAVAYGGDYEDDPPSIYIKSDNTWIEKPVYDENVFEADGGRVIIDLEEDKTISLTKKDDLVIESIFDESASDIEWIVEDKAIAKVENGKIIPLKVGSTVLTATNGGVNYRINLVVTSDLLNNPKTLNISYVLVSLIAVGILGSVVYKKQKSN